MTATANDRSTSTTTISDRAASIADALLDRVVLVQTGPGSGTGVIWAPDGLIVTNSHVMHHDEARVRLRNGDELHAKLIARDPQHDLAALQVDQRDLPAITAGDSTRVRVGQLVLAVGNPLGLRNVVTAGIITGVGKIGLGPGQEPRELLQADVALAPGNSGGPLTDVEGRVLGINAMVGPAGMALAIPTATVLRFLGPRGSRVYLGVKGLPVQIRGGSRPRAALLLTDVEEGGPASRAGLLQGDVLVSLDGEGVETEGQLLARVHAHTPGSPLRISGLRGDKPAEFTVVPEERVRM